MMYDEMVKCAYEEICDGIEKEAFWDSVGGTNPSQHNFLSIYKNMDPSQRSAIRQKVRNGYGKYNGLLRDASKRVDTLSAARNTALSSGKQFSAKAQSKLGELLGKKERLGKQVDSIGNFLSSLRPIDFQGR